MSMIMNSNLWFEQHKEILMQSVLDEIFSYYKPLVKLPMSLLGFQIKKGYIFFSIAISSFENICLKKIITNDNICHNYVYILLVKYMLTLKKIVKHCSTYNDSYRIIIEYF